jgi:hypothetical protein
MNRTAISNAVLGCGLATLLAAFGCGGDHNATNGTAAGNGTGQPAAAGADRTGTPGAATGGAAGTSGTAADENNSRTPVTLTGCLQKGDGRSDYILTEINQPRTSVGTSGSASANANDKVGQEQMRAAEHAYKLSADNDTLEPLVGKQVRVSGTVERRSQLNEHNDNGTVKDRDRTKIDADDLASVHVASIDSIADGCGAASAQKGSAKSTAKRAPKR